MYLINQRHSKDEHKEEEEEGDEVLHVLNWSNLCQPKLYRGTSLKRNRRRLGPYSRTMPRALWWSYGGGLFLMSKAPLY